MESLDGLRGIAALIVVFAHSMVSQPFYWNLRFVQSEDSKNIGDLLLLYSPLRIFYSGDKAVILFFLLSGFVLSLPWINSRQLSYGGFLVSRVCRIYLPYCAAMALAAVLAFIFGGAPIPGAGDWVNVYGWVNDFSIMNLPSIILVLGNGFSSWINNPTWSLVWEMRVSLLFPLLIVPVIRWRLWGAFFVALVLYGLYCLGSFFAGEYSEAAGFLGQPQDTFYFAGYFLAGIVLAIYREFFMALASKGKGIGALAFLVSGCAVWIASPISDNNFFKALGGALVIVAAISEGAPRGWLNKAVVQWLGRVSYSLYLVHVPTILAFHYILYGIVPYAVISVIAIPISLVVAELFYRVVERPSHDLGRSLVKRMSIRASMEAKPI